MSEERMRTGMDRASRRATYVYMESGGASYLSIQSRASVDAP
jgi:hypothetical protein